MKIEILGTWVIEYNLAPRETVQAYIYHLNYAFNILYLDDLSDHPYFSILNFLLDEAREITDKI